MIVGVPRLQVGGLSPARLPQKQSRAYHPFRSRLVRDGTANTPRSARCASHSQPKESLGAGPVGEGTGLGLSIFTLGTELFVRLYSSAAQRSAHRSASVADRRTFLLRVYNACHVH
jgi:hypothetical protein